MMMKDESSASADRHRQDDHPGADSFAECGRTTCPSLMALEADARAGTTSSLASGCARCRQRLEAVHANQRLLDELVAEWQPQQMGAPQSNPIDVPPALPGYTILEPISAGGQATVYRALHQASKRVVAIKVMHGVGAEPLASARLERELQILARFRHPGIVTVYDGGWTTDGLPYIVMELIEGGTLKERASSEGFHDSRPGIRAAVILVRDVADAVAAAQLTGLIHRDLKPGNILIDERGHPKVADFGVARERDAGGDAGASFVGSIAYAAPEQFNPAAVVDARVDVFALGLVLRELVVGHRLRRDPLRANAAPSARHENPLVPVDVDRIIERATAEEPAQRYASAAELADDLGRWLGGYPIRQRQSQRTHVLIRFVGRHPIGIAVVALFLATLVLYAIGITRSAAMIRAQNLVLERRLQERESVMNAISEPLAALDTVVSLDSFEDINDWLVRAADAVDEQLGDSEPLQARLLSRFGRALLSRREYAGAERCLTKANEIELALASNAPTPRLGETLHDLGRLSWSLSRSDRRNADEHRLRSIGHYESALEVRRAVLPPDAGEVALTKQHLGTLYSESHRFDEADALFAEAIRLREARAAQWPRDLTNALNSHATHLVRKGAWEEADAQYAHAEQIARSASDRGAVARVINSRGTALRELNRISEARNAHAEAREISMRLYGVSERLTIECTRNLALAMLDAHEASEAEAIATEALRTHGGQNRLSTDDEIGFRFVTLAAQARLSPGEVPTAALRELWASVVAPIDGPIEPDSKEQRLRVMIALELAEALITPGAQPQDAISPDRSEELAVLLNTASQDLRDQLPSPRRDRDMARLDALCRRAGIAPLADTMEP